MPNKVAPTNIWEIPKEDLTAPVRIYEQKEAGRYGFTITEADHNASLVQDAASGDVLFQDTVVQGTLITLIRGRMAISSLAQI
jgi:hypothetical protein